MVDERDCAFRFLIIPNFHSFQLKTLYLLFTTSWFHKMILNWFYHFYKVWSLHFRWTTMETVCKRVSTMTTFNHHFFAHTRSISCACATANLYKSMKVAHAKTWWWGDRYLIQNINHSINKKRVTDPWQTSS